ncbi:hypothetical protein [Kitasatospora sp. GP82]|uniref:hypothetical protein n=1 Tax=Kitasatospora sp. GP82 TaxID=3035089 RepID=UPI0024768605|nr:hypothetical protein [Kitasatospora sp. GP82]MDH6130286.1 hypothetical protein [Kitasatospora sp. GP82]
MPHETQFSLENPATRATPGPPRPAARPAALAHDVLAALGKPYTPPGRWNTQPALTWAAAAAWARTMRLHHLILLRGHLLTLARWRHLLAFQQRTGAHLTIVCHRTPTPAITRALAGTDHTITPLLTLTCRPYFKPQSTAVYGPHRILGAAVVAASR